MRYLPQTEIEIQKMCETIGVENPSDLFFQSIPQKLRFQGKLGIPAALSEQELLAHLKALSKKNKTVDHATSFLGAGAYHHYIPVAVSSLMGRGEFLTGYTPYQPELSQGTLQAIFEFQTMVASLLGMDIANASTYDGSTSLAEAVLMALRLKSKKQKVLLARNLHPEYRKVVQTVLHNMGTPIEEVNFSADGRIDLADLQKKLTPEVAVFCAGYPNYFGVIEDLAGLAKIIHANDSLFVTATQEALSLALLKSPGSCAADIAVAEGQSFGNFLNNGGPYVGLFACKQSDVRQMPGRIVGQTLDAQGKRGFVLTLSTREQHIRREKATSNICTNQSLCALGASIYLALLGPVGLKKLAEMNVSRLQFAKRTLSNVSGVELVLNGPAFNEFVIKLSKPVEQVLKHCLQQEIFAGVSLKKDYPELGEALLLCVTEMNSRADIERFAQVLKKVN
ncbi:MAG: aminomethyl-transferring glycine dehydrogenase subunit GcvPA [Deltaproteobacteria bacterium]|nr:aminomethyl-transferring glycine dehydrogenase subunit GcvPA [Deltaproteobacteria bacterium]